MAIKTPGNTYYVKETLKLRTLLLYLRSIKRPTTHFCKNQSLSSIGVTTSYPGKLEIYIVKSFL